MRPVARRGIVCAAFGVVTTLVIAWAAALVMTPRFPDNGGQCRITSRGVKPELWCSIIYEQRFALQTYIITVDERQGPDSIGLAWEPFQGTTRGEPVWTLQPDSTAAIRRAILSQWGRYGFEVENDHARRLPPFPLWLGSIPPTKEGLVAFGGRGAGWPFTTMRSLLLVDAATRETNWVGLVRVRPFTPYGLTLQSQDPQNGTLPLLPHPVLFPLSVLMWGGALFGIWSGAAVAVRRRRRKRGACGACGYDLRGTIGGCPECGAMAGTS